MQVDAAAKHSSKRAPALTYPVLSLYCWVDVHFILGLCWCILGLCWCQSCSCWCSCCASGCLVSVLVVLEVVVSSLMLLVLLLLGMLRRLGVYVGASWDYLLRLCWGLLAYVGPSWDYVGRSWVVCWAILALSRILGLCWVFVGSSWAYVGPAWDYVGRSWVLCWAILALCWPILGHVARCSNLTPCNSPQRAVFTVIYSVFCTFPTPILTPKSLQITLPPPTPPPHGCRR